MKKRQINKRIHFISKKHKLFNKKKLSNNSEKDKIKSLTKNLFNKFEIRKIEQNNSQIFSETTNYYLEYWKMYYENEYILAKIKEIVYEIDTMKTHIDELKNIESNLSN